MTLIERLTSTPEDKRLFEQERVIFEVTEMISKLMEEQGVTKADLARKLDTSKANITQMLDGRRNMTLRSIVDVTFHLNASLSITTRSLAPAQDWYDVTFRVVGGQRGHLNWEMPTGDWRQTGEPAPNRVASSTRMAV